MPRKSAIPEFDPAAFLEKAAIGQAPVIFPKRKAIFSQGGTGDSVFYIQKGRVRVTVVSKRGKEATLALLGPGDFIGEDCIVLGQKRMASAIAVTDCTVLKLTRKDMLRYLGDKVAKWSVPDDVVFVPELPHTATGKLLNSKLREQFANYQLQSA
jgi:CRP-like cAMP-binding protein